MRAVIVQARLRSTRLPGKVLLRLKGETVLWHVLQRCKLIDADTVICAIPDTPGHDKLIEEAEKCGALVVRGPEFDVLERYHIAAMHVGADQIIRVTSDCPLIDPGICDRVAKLLDGGLDYTSNIPRSWPQGLDCEAFTFAALTTARNSAKEDHDREHVGPWMARHLDTATVIGPVSTGRWVLDYPEDYSFLQALFEYLPDHFPPYEEIQGILDEHPEISSLNQLRRRHEERDARLLEG